MVPPDADRAPTVGAVVVVHGMNPWLADCLDALEHQCDEIVVIDNLPDDETTALLASERLTVHANRSPRSFAENVNLGVDRLSTTYVAIVNPDAVADPDCLATLVEFLESESRPAIAAPQLRWPDGTPQPTGRGFPTPGATIVRRTPLRGLWRPTERQRRHYRLDQFSAVEPWRADWLLGAFWMLRRDQFAAVGGMDPGYRMYVEDMDFCARADDRGLARWVVPAATAEHEYQAVIDRRFISRRNWWHLRGMVRFARTHPSRLRATPR